MGSTFSLAVALSEIQQGNQGSNKGMQLLVTSVFRWTPRLLHLFPHQEKTKKLYTGRIRFFPTVCTIGPIHYLLRKSHLQKTKLNQSEPFIIDCVPQLLQAFSKNSDMIGEKAWCGYTVQACASPFKQKFTFFFFKVGEGGDGQKKNLSSVLMALAPTHPHLWLLSA